MIPRYKNPEIEKIWSDENKLNLWRETELAVIQARVNLGILDETFYQNISITLREHEIDIGWWLARDREINHDLNAFIDERLRFLPPNLQCHFHDGMTSYDTEEPALGLMLKNSVSQLEENLSPLDSAIVWLARRYRYTIMNGRTHGQEAGLQSFGKRCLAWLAQLRWGIAKLTVTAHESLRYSKLSGAIGNYRGLDPSVEKEALRILGFEPFYGATQIMPRELYAPIAQAVCQIVLTLEKIAIDIRLGARSDRPIYQEPFGKKQKGSSAMPYKKNTIATEQVEGMARMAKGFCQMIQDNIVTWEERAIEQSSVERVAWPDLFHVAIHAAKTMTRVLQGLQVFPDNMLLEIIDSRGCYAAGEAKEFLRQHGAAFGLSTEDAYRIVQLAAFNVFEPSPKFKEAREKDCKSLQDADFLMLEIAAAEKNPVTSIQSLILKGMLRASTQLEATNEIINRWNRILIQVFSGKSITEWNDIFRPSYLLRNEDKLYQEILGE